MKKAKFILPIMAFLFAIVTSLATVNAKSNLAVKRVSLPAPSACANLSGTCETTGATAPCENDDDIVVREYFTGTGTCGASFNGIWED
jgi:hypothetical protein